MTLDYIKEKKKIISIVLSGISVLFGVLIFMRIASYFKLSAQAQNIEDMVQTIIATDSNKPEDLSKYFKPGKEIADSLKKNNLFVKAPERKNPITEIRCILGNEVCINEKWYKEGEMVQDAKILKIEPAQVTIEWDGKTTVFKPLDAPMASPGQGERPPSGPGSPPRGSPGMAPIPPSFPGQPPGMIVRP
jgi:hypothetical protein